MVTSQWRSQPQVDCCSAPIWPRGIIMFRYLRENLFFYGWEVIHYLQYNSTVFTTLDILALSLNRTFIVSTFFLFQLTNTRDLVGLIYDVISNVPKAINDWLFLLNYVSMRPFQHYFNISNQSKRLSIGRIRPVRLRGYENLSTLGTAIPSLSLFIGRAWHYGAAFRWIPVSA